MANSTYLTKTVEPFVVKWVSQQLGVPLVARRLVVGHRSDGSPVHFAFDGVSDDSTTALLVSTSLTLKPGGTRKLHADACVLLRTELKRRVMAFISDATLENFRNKVDGLLPLTDVEMMVCHLPEEMMQRVLAFQEEARSEVGDKGVVWRVGVPRK